MKSRYELVRWCKAQGANFTCSQPGNSELYEYLAKTPFWNETQKAVRYKNKIANQWFSYCLMLIKQKNTIPAPKTPDFYQSREWLELRYQVLIYHGRRCMCCGATNKEAKLHVDHIKPRSLYPKLELTFSNLQVLCEACNLGKSNKRMDDLRVIQGGKAAS